MTTHLSPHHLPLTGPALGERLRAVVGPDYVRQAAPEDAVSGVPGRWVVEPGCEDEIASLLRFAGEARLSVIPRGGGTKLTWGNPPRRADVILSLLRLNRVVEHTWADMTVTVEAGCTIGQLQGTLAKHGQRLALDPLWPERATVGGVLSANDTGALRLCYGGLRDLVIGVTLALADGTLAKSGGKVVKNVAGYDLPKLATGAIGTLGIITRAIFRVHPLPAAVRILSLQAGNVREMQRIILDLLRSNLSCTQIQGCLSDDAAPTIYVGLEGGSAGLAAQEARIRELVQPVKVCRATGDAWPARQELWSPPEGTEVATLSTLAAIAKISVLPSKLGEVAAALAQLVDGRRVRWRAVLQATGIGWIRVEAGRQDPVALPDTIAATTAAMTVTTILAELRAEIESGGGSLSVLRMPSGAAATIDAWGSAGDALPVMVALKRQLDPYSTLNPGRFVGGI